MHDCVSICSSSAWKSRCSQRGPLGALTPQHHTNTQIEQTGDGESAEDVCHYDDFVQLHVRSGHAHSSGLTFARAHHLFGNFTTSDHEHLINELHILGNLPPILFVRSNTRLQLLYGCSQLRHLRTQSPRHIHQILLS